MENKKINFFKKVWYSITKFDKYPDMAAEGIRSAIKYLIIISAIVSSFLVINSVIEMNQVVLNVASYLEDKLPDFSYSNNNIIMDINEPIIISDIKHNSIDKIIIAPYAETPEEKTKVENENTSDGITFFFFRNQIVLRSKIENKDPVDQPYLYEDFVKNYTQENIKEFNKAQLIEYMRSPKMNSYYMKYGLSATFYLFMTNILIILINTVEIAVLGWIAASTLKIKLKFSALFNMAVYSITLSTILDIIYIIVNYFIDFTISYFQVVYIAIAFVYMAAAIFMLKDDFVKRQQEVNRIKEEQEKVREEILRQEEEKEKEKEEKDDNEENNNNDENNEPNGSEA